VYKIIKKINLIKSALSTDPQDGDDFTLGTFLPQMLLIIRAHSFPRQILANSLANLVNSAAHRGITREIPRLTAATQVKFRGIIKSWINKWNTC